jgi:hypothetical protein
MRDNNASLRAPLIRYTTAGAYAFLLDWEQRPDGTWAARIAWFQKEGAYWRGVIVTVRADDVEAVPGQDYTPVPRRYEMPNF